MKKFFQKTIKENVLTTNEDYKKDLRYFYSLNVKRNMKNKSKIEYFKNSEMQKIDQEENLNTRIIPTKIQTLILEINIKKNLLRLLPEKTRKGISHQKINLTKILASIKNQNQNQMKNPLTKLNRKLRKNIFSLTPKFLALLMIASTVFSFSFGANVAYAAATDTTAPTVAVAAGVSTSYVMSGNSTGSNTVSVTDTGGTSSGGAIYARKQNSSKLTTRANAVLNTSGPAGIVISGSPTGFTFSPTTTLYSSVVSTGSSVTVTPTSPAGHTQTITVTTSGGTAVVASGVASAAHTVSSTTSSITVLVQEAGYLDTTYIIRITLSSPFPTSTGASTSDSGSTRTYVFNSSGTFNDNALSSITLDKVLVVGGGGAGAINGQPGGAGGKVNEVTNAVVSGQKNIKVSGGVKWGAWRENNGDSGYACFHNPWANGSGVINTNSGGAGYQISGYSSFGGTESGGGTDTTPATYKLSSADGNCGAYGNSTATGGPGSNGSVVGGQTSQTVGNAAGIAGTSISYTGYSATVGCPSRPSP